MDRTHLSRQTGASEDQSSLEQEQHRSLIQEGQADLEAGRIIPGDQVFQELREHFAAAIQQGIADVDAGRVVDHDDVVAWIESWDTENELKRPECE